MTMHWYMVKQRGPGAEHWSIAEETSTDDTPSFARACRTADEIAHGVEPGWSARVDWVGGDDEERYVYTA